MTENKQVHINNIEELDSLVETREADTLLECLLFLAKYHQRPASAESLTAGLAIHNELMSPKMFSISASRIGLIVKTVQRKIEDISTLALPSVLMIGTSKSCVLLDLDVENNSAVVMMPDVSKGNIQMPISELNQMYNGYMLVIKPAYNFNNRIEREITIEQPKKWFWGLYEKISRYISK